MISSEMKSIVAQNCPAFEPQNSIIQMSAIGIAENCNVCIHFVRNKCIKNLLDDIKDKIERN
jgi:hypothetical protein